MLQGKLLSQEDDFRLQNTTLMTELSKLCTQIEQLEQENQLLKEEGGASAPSRHPSSSSTSVNGEQLRLQAENSTLQKKLKGESDFNRSRTWFNVFSQQDTTWGHVRRTWGHERRTWGHESKTWGHENKTWGHERRTWGHENKTWGHEPNARACVRVCVCMCVCVCVCRTKIDEINQRKDEELKMVNLRVQKLQSDITASNQAANQSAVSQEQVDNILQENDALRTNLAALEQIQTVKVQEMSLLREQQETLTAELQQRRADQEKLLAQRDDLSSQLQESSFANRKLLEQLTEEGREKDRLLRDLDESKKTAEKRKTMLDEMASQLNQLKSNHKEALSDLKLQHEKEVLGVRARYEKELRGLHEDKNRSEEELRQQLRDEKARTKELEGFQLQVEELQAQIQSMEGTKGWFERRLAEAEVSPVLQRSPTRVLRSFCPAEEHAETIRQLRQEIKDTVDGQRILEKKGSAALKDLKRQLQLERRRADKLQERLQEILTNSKTRTGLEELVLSELNSPSRTQQTGDSSSVSSFSYRDMMKEAQPARSPQPQRPAELSDDEVGELFQRLADVQQEKWMLEEKVKHLEVSCSSMAEDICRKSAIIETYVMDSRAQGDRGGLGSVLRDLVKPGDENLREMNKKLQNMLEEQLTKNMHLQKDLELLSQELVRLSKESNGAAGSG
uniref:GRIP1 associated protein 1 n=1 Tax=Nothobranchius furzeri TaxID=105023 RepID=A0A8C6VYN7_NOTFU